MSAATLLVELFTEELPPKALGRLGEAFAAGLEAGLAKRGFLSDGSARTGYATPRLVRIALLVGVVNLVLSPLVGRAIRWAYRLAPAPSPALR